jgi:AcrR family transcriptional regulator
MAEPVRQAAAGPAPGRRPRAPGRTLGERQRQRREAMVAAAVDLIGTRGFAHTTIEDVCRRAGVSTRSFYEEFDDRHDLLAAVGEQVVAALFAVWSGPGGRSPGQPAGRNAPAHTTLRSRVANVVGVLAADPRLARLAFVELVGVSPRHEAERRGLLDVFPAWLEAYMRARLDAAGVPPSRQHTMAVAAVAGAHELIARWALQPPEDRRDAAELVDDVVVIGAAIYRAAREPAR